MKETRLTNIGPAGPIRPRSKYHDNESYALTPGEVAMSRPMLRSFFRELSKEEKVTFLDDYWTNRFEEHLLMGAANAAYVVATEPEFLVSALSTDNDDVLLLSFSKEIVGPHDLKVGDPLLSVNTYALKEELTDPDLVDGENSTGLYGSFYPLIAQFLSEDKNAIRATMLQLPEEEWVRVEELTHRRQEQDRFNVRPGNPFLQMLRSIQQIEPEPGEEDLSLKSLIATVVFILVVIVWIALKFS